MLVIISNIISTYRKYVENYGYNLSIKFVHSLDNICECQKSFVIQIQTNFGYSHLYIFYNLKDDRECMTLLGKTIDKFLISTQSIVF